MSQHNRNFGKIANNRHFHDLAITEETPVSSATGAILDPKRIMRMFTSAMQSDKVRENFAKCQRILHQKKIEVNGKFVGRTLVIADMARKVDSKSRYFENEGKKAAARVEREKLRLATGN